MELKVPPKDFGLTPLHNIKGNLDRIFGEDKWRTYEIETFSLEFDMYLDPLTKDKIYLLQVLDTHPQLFYNDVLFFLHAANVTNNNIADFDVFPLPTSLEIAYAHEEVKKTIITTYTYGDGVKKTIKYVLTLEGYSEPIWPFNEIGISSSELAKGQEPDDTKKKEIAIKRYIEALNDVQSRVVN